MNDGKSKYFGIGPAINFIKSGKKVARKGWNGKGIFIYYVPSNSYPTTSGVAKEIATDGLVPYKDYIALKTTDGTVSTWSPSCIDALADDWCIFEPETFADRLLLERDELVYKIDKLEYALERRIVPSSQIEILGSQLEVMKKYSSILADRIKNL